jgi:hypothetical protein
VEPGEGEFGLLLLHPVLTGDGIHAQSPLEHEPLANLNPVLEVLSEISPAHHLQLTRGIIGTKAIDLDSHFRHWRLVVLGVPHLGGFQHFNLEQAVIHTPGAIGGPHPDARP